ncbi:MAG TPA: ABC transporter permease [Candidatus Hydrogenedentes bacterium]|nr:ABC transporter permease [Candidatus Hydrogenedentota bacterium]HQE82131.1 ABC transporter permease [Candidatus Hydrogenedentota bacterium]HQH52101.1 ABC transporter permease [Candidatus Hydrogenedentota bacterium]HQM48874.1 ABC transporter permease [Candidatus Hydrogenedentota bacterium]
MTSDIGARRNLVLTVLETAGIYAVAAALLVSGIFVSPEFLTAENLLSILSGVALLGIVASGMAFVTYSGNMADLSIPAIMAFSGIIAVASLSLGLIPALALGILAGLAIGAMNGLVVGKLNANPILWTLAVAFFMEGFMRFTWSNNQIYPDIEPGTPGAAFIEIFRMRAGPVPLIVLVMLVLFTLGHMVMTKTRFGRESQFVGSSRAAAKASGIRVSRVAFFNFLVAAFAASIAGIFITSMNKLGVFYLGQGYDFKAVTAVVIGGVMLSGGRGHMPGVFGGVLVIGLLTNIMTFLGVTSFRQNIVTGIVFIVVVGLQQYQLRARGKDYA